MKVGPHITSTIGNNQVGLLIKESRWDTALGSYWVLDYGTISTSWKLSVMSIWNESLNKKDHLRDGPTVWISSTKVHHQQSKPNEEATFRVDNTTWRKEEKLKVELGEMKRKCVIGDEYDLKHKGVNLSLKRLKQLK